MKAYYCVGCKGLLYTAEDKGDLDIEIQCQACQRINYPHRYFVEDIIKGPKGQDFMRKALNHPCVGCKDHRTLLKSIGEGYIEIRCKICKSINMYNCGLMRQGKWRLPK